MGLINEPSRGINEARDTLMGFEDESSNVIVIGAFNLRGRFEYN